MLPDPDTYRAPARRRGRAPASSKLHKLPQRAAAEFDRLLRADLDARTASSLGEKLSRATADLDCLLAGEVNSLRVAVVLGLAGPSGLCRLRSREFAESLRAVLARLQPQAAVAKALGRLQLQLDPQAADQADYEDNDDNEGFESESE